MGISTKLDAILRNTSPDQPVLVRVRCRAPDLPFPGGDETALEHFLEQRSMLATLRLCEYFTTERIPYRHSDHLYSALVAYATPIQIRAVATRNDVESIAYQEPHTKKSTSTTVH